MNALEKHHELGEMQIAFNRINKELNDCYHEKMRREGMSNSEFDILYSLCELGEGCTQRDICSVSWLPKQTVNSAIQKMEKNGLLVLLPGQGRERRIQTTKLGKEKIQKTIYPIIESENAAFAGLDEKEAGQMLQTFETYLRAIQRQFAKESEDKKR